MSRLIDNKSDGMDHAVKDGRRSKDVLSPSPLHVVGASNDENEPDPRSANKSPPTSPHHNNYPRRVCWDRWSSFYTKYEFPLLILLAIRVAKAAPIVGARYVHPHLTASWMAVIYIFLLSGLAMKTQEFKTAASWERLAFNGFVQGFNFGVVSIVVYVVSRFLSALQIVKPALADGMTICACLPMAINVTIVLTGAAGGDEAAAIFNASIGNLVGIVLSPVLILWYLGASGDMDLQKVFSELSLRVLLPLLIGQVLQRQTPRLRNFFEAHRRRFKKSQEYALVYIVYCVFCRTFHDGFKARLEDVMLMILCQMALMFFFMGVAWYCLRILFHGDPALQVMGLFGSYQKTVALGVPLISSIYDKDPNEALYTLPILIWHPMQLVIGTMMVPRLATYIQSETNRLQESAEHDTLASNRREDEEDELGASESVGHSDVRRRRAKRPQHSGEAENDPSAGKTAMDDDESEGVI